MYVSTYRSAADRQAALREHLDAWDAAAATAPDAQAHAVDAQHAAALGLPTLAAIHRALHTLTTAPTPREARVILTELRHIAQGEATIRVRRMLQDHRHPGVPGVGGLPQTILESQYGSSGAARTPRSRRGGARSGKGARRA